MHMKYLITQTAFKEFMSHYWKLKNEKCEYYKITVIINIIKIYIKIRPDHLKHVKYAAINNKFPLSLLKISSLLITHKITLLEIQFLKNVNPNL